MEQRICERDALKGRGVIEGESEGGDWGLGNRMSLICCGFIQ